MTALVLGHSLEPSRARELADALHRGNLEPSYTSDVQKAMVLLRNRRDTGHKAIFIDPTEAHAEEFVAWVRGESELCLIPIVALVANPTERSFSEAHAIGADDVVVKGDVGAITRRAVILSDLELDERPPPSEKGRAVVAHPDQNRRKIIGKTLRLALFDPVFAADHEEMIEVARHGDCPSLVVFAETLNTEGSVQLIDRTRMTVHRPDLPMIMLTMAPEALPLVNSVTTPKGVAMTYERASAENLLFLANELLAFEARNSRASERLLHQTLVSYRRAGEFLPSYGLTYNISKEGIYIRTLDPIPSGQEVWLELRPPHCGAAVHLRAMVRWARPAGPYRGGAAPPGFGCTIETPLSPRRDLENYLKGYADLQSSFQRPKVG